jgi:hypothetical protein
LKKLYLKPLRLTSKSLYPKPPRLRRRGNES